MRKPLPILRERSDGMLFTALTVFGGVLIFFFVPISFVAGGIAWGILTTTVLGGLFTLGLHKICWAPKLRREDQEALDTARKALLTIRRLRRDKELKGSVAAREIADAANEQYREAHRSLVAIWYDAKRDLDTHQGILKRNAAIRNDLNALTEAATILKDLRNENRDAHRLERERSGAESRARDASVNTQYALRLLREEATQARTIRKELQR